MTTASTIDLSAVRKRPAGRSRPAQWVADLLMGARLAAAGGRDGLTRTAMTAVGVGLGVAMLLLAAAVPATWASRTARMGEREPGRVVATAGPETLLLGSVSTPYRGHPVRGKLVRAEGPGAPVPPGLPRLPAAGEAYVSPALRDLLASPEGALLRPRLPYRIAGTIRAAGLSGPAELAYYAGSDRLSYDDDGRLSRVAAFGAVDSREGLDPVLLLFVVVIFVVLLLPVGVFVASAVRFGGEQRDRRLAALRLAGADSRMTRRIAAGDALAAAGLGLLAGAGFFLLGRHLAELLSLQDISVYAGDIRPGAGAVLLVAVVVPGLAVAVTLLALRGVVIEPLGVVRNARPARGRLWWRLLPPAAGLALLYPLLGRVTRDEPAPAGPYRIAAGVVLLLIGVTALLPWVVEATVARLGRGPVAWQLAVRRLQMATTSPGRVVNGIAVAVAGAIALQMLFLGLEPAYSKATHADLTVADTMVPAPAAEAEALRRGLTATAGATGVLTLRELSAGVGDEQSQTPVLLAGCADLRRLASLPSCVDGDVFQVGADTSPPGSRLTFSESQQPWQVPASTRPVPAARSGTGAPFVGLLATPGAVPRGLPAATGVTIYLRSDPADPDAIERIRNTVQSIEPMTPVYQLTETTVIDRFTNLRRGLFIGAIVTLLLIGLSLLVGVLEQLRDRRRLLAVLTAVGTRRSTLGWSVLWQTALPVTLGLVLAVPAGIGLGAVLLAMVGAPLHVEAPAVAAMAVAAGAVVLLVTAASLPVLWRITRADGLRTE